MSDQDLGKKLVEEEEIQPFLYEYKCVTGISLRLLDRRGERPDFICSYRDGLVGIELARVMQASEEEQMSGLNAAILIQETVYTKEAKRASVGWRHANQTILVVQLMAAAAPETVIYLDERMMDEMSATGFREIWVADYSVMEPYNTVQLFGVKPARWRGLHPHCFQGMKPYG
jgi:hypothetical protein